jgi:hypothetical protein
MTERSPVTTPPGQPLQIVRGKVSGAVRLGHEFVGLTLGMPVERRTGPLTWGLLNTRTLKGA